MNIDPGSGKDRRKPQLPQEREVEEVEQAMEAKLHTEQAHSFECAVSTLLRGSHPAAMPAIGENVPNSLEYRKRVVLPKK